MEKKIKTSSYEIRCKNSQVVKAVIAAVNTGGGSDVVIDGNGEDVLDATISLISAVMQTMLESEENDKAIINSFSAMCAIAFEDALKRRTNRFGGALS